MTSAVAAVGLSVRYGQRVALDDVSLALEAGTIVAIIGPNGAGKSTLLKALAGLAKPAAGAVRLLGRDLSGLARREVARVVAMVPAEARSVFDFSVEELVMMGRHAHLRLLGEPGADDVRAVDEALARTGTAGLRQRHFEELSSGERQGVILAQALAQEPRVLLLDEPTTHLDLGHAVAFLDLVKELAIERALAVALVSHDLNQAAEYADRVALLKGARLVREGSPAEVLDYRLIEEVYETVVVVKTNPISGRPHVVPVSRWSLGEHGG